MFTFLLDNVNDILHIIHVETAESGIHSVKGTVEGKEGEQEDITFVIKNKINILVYINSILNKIK